MNFLAHLYLSGNDREIMVGNFIGDHVKGKQVEQYAEKIRKGILLHRFIDSYTDSHPVMMESKNRLRPFYRKYTPVITDVFYDHFLAANWKNYSEIPLEQFAAAAYQILEEESAKMPVRTQQMLPYMIRYNWLVNYANLEGLQRILSQMSQRTKFESRMGDSVNELKLYYNDFKKEFEVFFPELIAEAINFLKDSR